MPEPDAGQSSPRSSHSAYECATEHEADGDTEDEEEEEDEGEPWNQLSDYDFLIALDLKLESVEDLKAFRTLVRLTGPTFMGNISARYSSGFASITILYLFLLTFMLVSSLEGGDSGSGSGSGSDGQQMQPDAETSTLPEELADAWDGNLFTSGAILLSVLVARAVR